MPKHPRIALIAGEISGDILGAGLIQALKQTFPNARFEGIGGEGMQAAGLHSYYPMEWLSVMGLFEVLGSYRRLKRCHTRLQQLWTDKPPDIFIGIDAPDFNLPMAEALKPKGIKTVHYVSPSVWAWRSYRIKKIARACDYMLTLFPFEAQYYQQHQIPVCFVGHPLAEKIPFEVDTQAAREALDLDTDKTYVALLPGSRRNEVERLLPEFLKTAVWLQQQRPDLSFILPSANDSMAKRIDSALKAYPNLKLQHIHGRSREVMAAADVVLLASGTATLEALLLKKPMVVAYKLAGLTYQIAKHLVNVPYVSLPNLLSGRALVPEHIQTQVSAPLLGQALLDWLEQPEASAALQAEYLHIHQQLAQNADKQAAKVVEALLLDKSLLNP